MFDPYGLLSSGAGRVPVPSVDDLRRDLDETRRLCYMALVVSRAGGRHELAGTLINALLHHSRIPGDRDDVIDLILAAIRSEEPGVNWLTSVIDGISATLGGGAAPGEDVPS